MNLTSGHKMELLTIGYEKRSIEPFIEALVAHDVQTLVDVRELPRSRKRGFSKTSLEEALKKAGIDYLHVRAVGNPKKIRKAEAPTNEILSRYERHMRGRWDEALEPMKELLPSSRLCLMCYERSASECHRSFVAEELAERYDEIDIVNLD